mmetsp:Transcript_8707/g.15806  ORF Transcript_8707/g.15806 Transcript_8707/m.15806 type:complete len:242 (+) Transcript_8707:957-1682(+)
MLESLGGEKFDHNLPEFCRLSRHGMPPSHHQPNKEAPRDCNLLLHAQIGDVVVIDQNIPASQDPLAQGPVVHPSVVAVAGVRDFPSVMVPKVHARGDQVPSGLVEHALVDGAGLHAFHEIGLLCRRRRHHLIYHVRPHQHVAYEGEGLVQGSIRFGVGDVKLGRRGGAVIRVGLQVVGVLARSKDIRPYIGVYRPVSAIALRIARVKLFRQRLNGPPTSELTGMTPSAQFEKSTPGRHGGA